jgi:replicative DNA helicase
MTEIVPPHSIPAEQSVLGALMQSPAKLAEVSDFLSAGDFWRRDHALIYQAISDESAAGRPVDPVTLSEVLDGAGLSHHVGGLGYLVELAQTTPSAANLVAYAEIVAEKSRLRRVADAGNQLATLALSASQSSADIAALGESMLRELAPTRSGGLRSIRGALKSAYEAISARYEGTAQLGIGWPWQGLSSRVRLVPGEVTLLAARPSVGKSALAFQAAAHAAQSGVRTAVFSLEMPEVSVINRMLSAVGSVPYDWIRQPDDNEAMWPRLGAAMRELDGIRETLMIDDTGGLTASQIVARCRRDHLRNSLGLIVIDHIHELRLAGKQGEVIERPEALREFKRMAKELKVPVLCLAQLSRAGATGERPTLTELRGSGGLEEVADTVLLLHRPDYFDPADRPGLIELIVAKARDGERGIVVNLQNDYKHMRALDWIGPIPEQKQAEKPRWGSK